MRAKILPLLLLSAVLAPTSAAYAVLPDTDGDGYPDTIDCKPADAAIHPRAVEIPYDGIDQDCAGGDLCDVDLDGVDATGCGGTDCDDEDPGIHPASGAVVAAVDVPGNGIDEDCSGSDAPVPCDGDADGHDALFCGGDDCNDALATVHPGATEIDADGIDQDCDGLDDCVPVSWAQGGWCSTGSTSVLPWGVLLAALLRRRAVDRRGGR